MRKTLPLAALTMTLLLLAGAAGAQTIYRCTGPGGQPSFQQAPCDGDKRGAIEVRPINSLEPFPALQERVARNAAGAGTMSEADMVQALGHPSVVNTDVVNGQVTRQHVYQYGDGSRRYVYTRDGEVFAAQVRPALYPRHTAPCHSRQEIANARTSASSIILTPDQRKAAQERVREMEKCGR